MRNHLYVVLAAAGLAGLALLLLRFSGHRRGGPVREAERLVDRCQDMLSRLESAVGKFQEPEASS